MKIPIISNWIIKKRIKYASKFGKLEHKAGRILGWELGTLCITGYFILVKGHAGFIRYSLNYPTIFRKIFFVALLITFATWTTYLLSHILEKKAYGHFGPRG